MISIILITYNELKRGSIRRTLDQISALPNSEIICIDLGSTDGTLTLLKQYPMTLLNSKNTSMAAIYNFGIHHCKQEMILLYPPRTLIETQGLDYLINNSSQLKWGSFEIMYLTNNILFKTLIECLIKTRSHHFSMISFNQGFFFRRKLIPNLEIIPETEWFEDFYFSKLLYKNSGSPNILPFHVTQNILKTHILNKIKLISVELFYLFLCVGLPFFFIKPFLKNKKNDFDS